MYAYQVDVLRPLLERVFGADAPAGGPPPCSELQVHHLQGGRRAEALV